MSLDRVLKKCLLVVILFAVGLVGGLVAQTPTWKAELLGTPPSNWSLTAVSAINDAGQVTGNMYLSGYKRAWITGPGQALEILPLPSGATWSQAYDINSAGVVVGSVLLGSSTSRAVIWTPGAIGYESFLIPTGPGGHDPFDAQGINDAGDVVGKYGIFGGSYHWNEATGVTQITTSAFPDVPYDVNEQGQIVSGSYRMDLDTFVLEDLGNPTQTSYSYIYTELTCINDAGECGGYAVVATSGPPYLAVRYTDGPVWKLFNSFPWTSASVQGLAASGDTVYQLGAYYGMHVYVEGHGNIALQDILAPAYTDWNLTDTYSLKISRGSGIACTGWNSSTNEYGILLLTPMAFEDLGGASRGALGDPVLSGYGTLVPGDPARVRLASAAPDSVAYFAWSSASNPLPLYGGTLYANPWSLLVPFQTDALGRFEKTFAWPSVSSGKAFYLQVGVVDPESADGIALSNALKGVTQ